MGWKTAVDDKHMVIHKDNPEKRGWAAGQLVLGSVHEAQLEQQMALIAYKCWGGRDVED